MDPIYLDHAASTPVRPEVTAIMVETIADDFGNPSSQHYWGRIANTRLEDARQRVASALGVHRTEVYFVRGGTESNNIAILGRVNLELQKGNTPLVVTSEIEHKAVLETCNNAIRGNGELGLLQVSTEGEISPRDFEFWLQKKPTLISVMTVNNETGLCLPIKDLAELAQSYDVPIHTDAVQALGRIPMDLTDLSVSLLSLSGHKINGPKGTGILFVRRGIELAPLIFGGGQEKGIRPGTQDVVGAIGISKALELSVSEEQDEGIRIAGLRDTLQTELMNQISDLKVHGHNGPRAPHILNVGIPALENDTLLANLDMEGIAVSSGSACTSGMNSESHVLSAIYGDVKDTAVIRFSLGASTTPDEIHKTIEVTTKVIRRMRGQQN